MRIGVITDIHANLQALQAVLKDLEDAQIDYLACLGDVVGYGGQPDECCTLIRRSADVTIRGNHDAAVSKQMDYSFYRQAAREALDEHRSCLSDENLAWLAALPSYEIVQDVMFCHGAPPRIEAFDYLFTKQQVTPLVERYAEQAWVTFIGHSHLCKGFEFTPEGATEMLKTRYPLKSTSKYIISAGSVGQPRDYDARACSVVLDLANSEFEYRRVPYDFEAAGSMIRKRGISPAFAQRLALGV